MVRKPQLNRSKSLSSTRRDASGNEATAASSSSTSRRTRSPKPSSSGRKYYSSSGGSSGQRSSGSGGRVGKYKSNSTGTYDDAASRRKDPVVHDLMDIDIETSPIAKPRASLQSGSKSSKKKKPNLRVQRTQSADTWAAMQLLDKDDEEEKKPAKNATWLSLSPKRGVSRLERTLSFKAFSKKIVGGGSSSNVSNPKSLLTDGLGLDDESEKSDISVDPLSDHSDQGKRKSTGSLPAPVRPGLSRPSFYTSSPSQRHLMTDPVPPSSTTRPSLYTSSLGDDSIPPARPSLYTSSPSQRNLLVDDDDEDDVDPTPPRASLSLQRSLTPPARIPHQRSSDAASIAMRSNNNHHSQTTASNAVECRLRELGQQQQGNSGNRRGMLARASSMRRMGYSMPTGSPPATLKTPTTKLKRSSSGAASNSSRKQQQSSSSSLDNFLKPPNLRRKGSGSSVHTAPSRTGRRVSNSSIDTDSDDDSCGSEKVDAAVANLLENLGTAQRASVRSKDDHNNLLPSGSNHTAGLGSSSGGSLHSMASSSRVGSGNGSGSDPDVTDSSSHDEDYDNFSERPSYRSSTASSRSSARRRGGSGSGPMYSHQWRDGSTQEFFQDEYQGIMKDIVVRQHRQEDEAAAVLNEIPNLDRAVGAPSSRRASLQGVHDSFLMFSQKSADWNTIDQSVNLMDASSIANLDYDHTSETFGGRSRRASMHMRDIRGFQYGNRQQTWWQKCQSCFGAGWPTSLLPATACSRCNKDPRKRNIGILIVLLMIVLTISMYTIIPSILDEIEQSKQEAATRSSGNETPTSRIEQLRAALLVVSSPERLENEESPAYQALMWLSDTDPAQLEPDDPMLRFRFAFASLHFSTQHDTWTHNDQWMTEACVCDWYGVDCESSKVTHLNLTSNHMWGDIPLEFKALSDLRILDLSKNLQLKGSLTDDLVTSWTQMEYLLLQENRIGGQLPKRLGDLTELVQLSLWGNEFEGHIATSLNQLTKLRALLLQDCELTGTIPYLGSLRQLAYLHLDSNKLTSTIPSWVGKLTELHDLRLQGNSLSGTIPSELAKAENLAAFYAQDNHLEGPIPEIFEHLTQLNDLQLHRNVFRSSLPTSIQCLTNLRRFTIDHNGMTGTLPPEWGALTNLQALIIHHNTLIGPIPSTYGNMKSLRDLWVNHNFMQYEVPSELGKLTNSLLRLFLESNAFHGTVPAELGNLVNLEQLRVHQTRVTGTMPSAVCDLMNQNDNKLTQVQADCKKIACECCTKCF